MFSNQTALAMETKKPIIPEVLSYLTLRKTLGILGISLPIILVVGSCACGRYDEIQQSISAYYYTNMGNVLVGVLFAYGLFLFAYKGYGKVDDLTGDLGCIFALGVALFPCQSANPIIGQVHLISAAWLFLVFAYFSIVLFTKSKYAKQNLPKEKKDRNLVYRICGYTILVCILLMIIYMYVLKKSVPELASLKPIFWLETIALWAFGLSWIVKGNVILKDKKA